MSTITAGIDEAGRGALAGPVVAAACVFDGADDAPLITDSKKLTELQREDAYAYLLDCCAYGVGIVAADVIDDSGILAATEQAMQMAVQDLSRKSAPQYLLVDGRDAFWFDIPHSSIIKGDETEQCIAAASIIAKVTRDRWMCAVDAEVSGYGFAQHKGYGTQKHIAAIQKKGMSRLHRRSFLHKILSQSPMGAFSK